MSETVEEQIVTTVNNGNNITTNVERDMITIGNLSIHMSPETEGMQKKSTNKK